MTVLHHELHRTGIGNNLLYLPQIDQESAMTAHDQRISLQILFHLFGCGAKHIGLYIAIEQLAHFHIVTDGLNI